MTDDRCTLRFLWHATGGSSELRLLTYPPLILVFNLLNTERWKLVRRRSNHCYAQSAVLSYAHAHSRIDAEDVPQCRKRQDASTCCYDYSLRLLCLSDVCGHEKPTCSFSMAEHCQTICFVSEVKCRGLSIIPPASINAEVQIIRSVSGHPHMPSYCTLTIKTIFNTTPFPK